MADRPKLKSQEELNAMSAEQDKKFILSQCTYIMQAYSQNQIPSMVLTGVVNILNRINK